jgi:hypothetical protein
MHEDGNFGIAITPTHALHIKDSNFVGGEESTSIKIESVGIGGANGDALMIGFSAVGGTSNILGLGLRLQDGYKYVANYFGTDKMVLQLSTGTLSLSSLTGTGSQLLYANASGEITRSSIDLSSVTPIKVSATLNFPSTPAHSSSDVTVTVTGAAVGDVVTVAPGLAAISTGSCFTAWVSAANTVTVRYNHYGSGSSDPASATFNVIVTKY